MSDTSVAAGIDTRQSMIRVWMALSAVWVAFWLSIAAIIFAAVGIREPLAAELGRFAAIVLTPPVVLLILGAALRWTFEALTRAARR
jgi:hypothetical protein